MIKKKKNPFLCETRISAVGNVFCDLTSRYISADEKLTLKCNTRRFITPSFFVVDTSTRHATFGPNDETDNFGKLRRISSKTGQRRTASELDISQSVSGRILKNTDEIIEHKAVDESILRVG